MNRYKSEASPRFYFKGLSHKVCKQGIRRIKKPLQQTLSVLNVPNHQTAKAILEDFAGQWKSK